MILAFDQLPRTAFRRFLPGRFAPGRPPDFLSFVARCQRMPCFPFSAGDGLRFPFLLPHGDVAASSEFRGSPFDGFRFL